MLDVSAMPWRYTASRFLGYDIDTRRVFFHVILQFTLITMEFAKDALSSVAHADPCKSDARSAANPIANTWDEEEMSSSVLSSLSSMPACLLLAWLSLSSTRVSEPVRKAQSVRLVHEAMKSSFAQDSVLLHPSLHNSPVHWA